VHADMSQSSGSSFLGLIVWHYPTRSAKREEPRRGKAGHFERADSPGPPEPDDINLEELQAILRHGEIVGIGLDSSQLKLEPKLFSELYQQAEALGTQTHCSRF